MLEFDGQFYIYQSAGKIIGHRELVPLQVGNPEIGGNVVDVHQVEYLHVNACIFDGAQEFGFVLQTVAALFKEHEREAHVHASVPAVAFYAHVGGRVGGAVG